MMTAGVENKDYIIASDVLSFLSKYNLDITNVDTTYYEIPNATINKAKKLVTNKTVKYIYMLDYQEKSDVVKELESLGAKVITIKTMTVLSEEDIKNDATYETIMRENIDNIKKELMN